MNGQAVAIQHHLLELKAEVVLQVRDTACLTKAAKHFCIVPRYDEREHFVATSEIFNNCGSGRKDFANRVNCDRGNLLQRAAFRVHS